MEILSILKCSVLQLLLVTYIVVDSCGGDEEPLAAAAVVVYPQMLISTSSPNHLRLLEAESVVLINRIGIEVRIDCWASFPINLEFDGHLSNREVKVRLIKRSTSESSSSTPRFCFHINATLESFEEITGNYSCSNVVNSSERTSYYIFYSPSPPASLLNRGQRLIVVNRFALSEHPMEMMTMTLPCPTSIPNVTVHLFNEKNEKINLTHFGIEYDPKIGFKIPKSASSHFLGNFHCRTELSDADKVNIYIVPEKRSIALPSQNIILLREGDPLHLSCLSTEEMLMQIEFTNQSGKQVYRIISNEVNRVVQNSITSFYKVNLTYASNNNSMLRKGDTGRGSCWLSSTMELVHEWAFSVRERLSSNESNGIEGFNSHLCQNSGLGRRPANIKLYPCNNWIECNLIKCKRNDRTCTSYECHDANTFKCLPSGIIQCFNQQNESVQELIYFTGLGRNHTYTNWKHAPRSDILKIQSVRVLSDLQTSSSSSPSSSSFRDSIPVQLICEGSAFVVAVGFKWFLRPEPEQGNEVEIPENQIEHKWRSLSEQHIIRSMAKTSILQTSRNITMYVVCRAPIWNSTEWIEDQMQVKEWFKWTVNSSSSSSSSSTSTSTTSFNSFNAIRKSLLPFSQCIFLTIIHRIV